MKNLNNLIRTERDRLRAALDAEMKMGSNLNQNLVYNLESNLNQALQQNSELKKRLLRIHEVSDVGDLSTLDPISDTVSQYLFLIFLNNIIINLFSASAFQRFAEL